MASVRLKVVTRENWEEALNLSVPNEQKRFVPSVAVSLSKVYIKPDGDNVTYIPFAIYDENKIVGFIMHAYEENSTDSYWINGFLIDEKVQGSGHGKAALMEMIQWISTNQSQCKVIKLTVYPNNDRAKSLYINAGFVPTGEIYGDEEVFSLKLNNAKN